MKTYPKIMGTSRLAPQLSCVAFDKLDGSNLRFEWNRKKGWNKFGTRWRLFDETDVQFGIAIPLFKDTWSERLAQVLIDNKQYRSLEKATFYFEYYGERSFAGFHHPEDDKTLTLIDANVYKKGFLPPREFIRNFGHLDIAKVVYEGNLNKQFIEDVKNGIYDVSEGVVCKGWHKNKLWLRKIKTKWWLNELKTRVKENPEMFAQIFADNRNEQA